MVCVCEREKNSECVCVLEREIVCVTLCVGERDSAFVRVGDNVRE